MTSYTQRQHDNGFCRRHYVDGALRRVERWESILYAFIVKHTLEVQTIDRSPSLDADHLARIGTIPLAPFHQRIPAVQESAKHGARIEINRQRSARSARRSATTSICYLSPMRLRPGRPSGATASRTRIPSAISPNGTRRAMGVLRSYTVTIPPLRTCARYPPTLAFSSDTIAVWLMTKLDHIWPRLFEHSPCGRGRLPIDVLAEK